MTDSRNGPVILGFIAAILILCSSSCCVGSLLGGSGFLDAFSSIYDEGMRTGAMQTEWAAYQAGISVFFALVGGTLNAAIPLAVGGALGCVIGLVPAGIVLALVFGRARRTVSLAE